MRSGMKRFLVVGTASLGALLVVCGVAIAQVSIGGQDASGQMKEVQTMLTTVQNIGFKWVAPVMGGILAIGGIKQIATRQMGSGFVALGCGGALFAIEKIANSLSYLLGN